MSNQRDLIVCCLAVVLGLCMFFLISHHREQRKELNDTAGLQSHDQAPKEQATKPTDFSKSSKPYVRDADTHAANHRRSSHVTRTKNEWNHSSNSGDFDRLEDASTDKLGYQYLDQLNHTHRSGKRMEILNQAREDLEDMAADEIQSLVTQAITDASHNVREIAKEMLSELDDDIVLATISAALSHESAEIRESAVYALEELDNLDIAGMLLLNASKDADQGVRNAVSDVAQSQPESVELDILNHQLRLHHSRYDALFRLKEIGTDEALAIIRAGLHDVDPDFQLAVDQVIRDLE